MNSLCKTLISTAAVTALALPAIGATAAMAAPADTSDTAAVSWSERNTQEYTVEQQELAAFLSERGFTATIGEDGSAMFDETNADAWETVNDFYDAEYPPTQADIDRSQADATELADYLTKHGITATVVVEDGTLAYVDYDPASQAALDAVEDFAWSKNPLPQDVIDEMNAETAKMAEFLTSRGVSATLTTDRHGVQEVEADWGDQAVLDAAMAYWADNPGILVGN